MNNKITGSVADRNRTRLSDNVTRNKPVRVWALSFRILLMGTLSILVGCSILPLPVSESSADPLEYYSWVSTLDDAALHTEQQRLETEVTESDVGDSCTIDCINLALALTVSESGMASGTDRALSLLERARNQTQLDPDDDYTLFADLWQQHLVSFQRADVNGSARDTQEISIDFMRNQIAGLQSQIAQKEERILTQEGQLSERQSQISLMKKQIAALQKQIEELTRLEQQIIEREDFQDSTQP